MTALSGKIGRQNIPSGVFIALLVLVVGVGTLLLSLIINELATLNNERRAVEFVTVVRPLIRSIPESRGLCSTDAHGDSSFFRRCLDAGRVIDDHMNHLRKFAATARYPLALQQQIQSLITQWQLLKQNTQRLSPGQIFTAHTDLMRSVIRLTHNVADEFKLTRDDRLGTFYLTDIAIDRLPAIIDSLGQIRGLGSEAAARGVLDENAEHEILIQIDRTESALKLLQDVVGHLAETDQLWAKSHRSLINAAVDKSSAFIAEVRAELGNVGAINVDRQVLFEAGTLALDEYFKIYDSVLPTLSETLGARVTQQTRKLYLSMIAFATILILLALLFRRLLITLRRLGSNETWLSAIFETMFDGLIVIDEQGFITAFNPAAVEIFGYRANELLGLRVSALIPEADEGDLNHDLGRYLKSQKKRNVIGTVREVRGLRKDGTCFPMELAINAAVIGNRPLVTGIVRDITRRKQAETMLATQHQQIKAINNAQSHFIRGGDAREFFGQMLPDLLALTTSEFGFIAEVMQDEKDQPYLKLYAQSNLAWDDETRAFYEQHAPEGLEFRNLNNLHGHVVLSGDFVISNDPATDARSGGLPKGHPPIASFLGVPIYLGDRLIGVIGLANRSSGYDQAVVDLLQPIMTTYAQLFDAIGMEQQRKRTDRDLKRANSFMAGLVENLQAGLLVEDEAGEIHTVNQTYCEMFGKDVLPLMIEGTSGEREFQNNRMQFADPQRFIQQRQNCLSGQRVVARRELILQDGRIFEQDYVPIIYEDERGETHVNHLWTYRDISEHKKIQTRIAEQSNQIRQMQLFVERTLDALASSICVLDENGTILYVNEVWKEFGRGNGLKDPNCCLGANYLTVCDLAAEEVDASQAARSLRALLRGESEKFVSEYACHSPDRQRWMILHATRFDTDSGIRVVIAHDDISEQRQAIAAAEAGARAKSQFLATMSHEIRTPMNGVLGMLHLLSKTELDAKQRRYIETATGSGEMLLKVINDILDFSKLEAGKLELESIPFDLGALLEQTVALLAKEAHEKRLELLYLMDPALPRQVTGDPIRIRQVLTNLFNNAIKFTIKGEVVVYVSRLDQNLIRFGVRDSGIGMSKEQQKQLFKAFSQVDSSHTRKYGGTGLGLAISQKLIEAMGSTINVTSTVGIGADFSFDLLLEIAEHDQRWHEISPLLSNLRVLVVDDNAVVRELLRRIFQNWKVAKVGLAENGNDALRQLEDALVAGGPYDVAVLDQNMPKMQGLELARSVRANPKLSSMKLMMLSAVDNDRPAPEVDAWLAKPVRQTELYNRLLMIFDDAHQCEQPTPIPSQDQCPWFGGYKLLLVEDNRINQEVACEILKSTGCAIDVRENGAEAVQAVQDNHYDAVLMDIQMPVMDGLEAARNIRALGARFVTLPIIAMTAHALGEDADKSLAAGMNGHVTKPIDPAATLKVLAQWIKPHGESASPVTTVVSLPENIPDLPGIDLADGMERLGNWEIYRRLLKRFRDRYIDAAARLENFVHREEWDEAIRLTHTLKGNSGNLGVKGLYELASMMEHACRAKDRDAVIAKLPIFSSRLEEVLGGLTMLEPEIDARNNVACDPVIWQKRLAELEVYLDNDLGEAQASLDHLRRTAPTEDDVTALEELAGAVNSFDIETAKEIIWRLQTRDDISNRGYKA